MDNRVKAAFSYVFGWITGIIFLAIEKEDEFVRKSAAQSFVLSLFLLACNLFGVLDSHCGAGAVRLYWLRRLPAVDHPHRESGSKRLFSLAGHQYAF